MRRRIARVGDRRVMGDQVFGPMSSRRWCGLRFGPFPDLLSLALELLEGSIPRRVRWTRFQPPMVFKARYREDMTGCFAWRAMPHHPPSSCRRSLRDLVGRTSWGDPASGATRPSSTTAHAQSTAGRPPRKAARIRPRSAVEVSPSSASAEMAAVWNAAPSPRAWSTVIPTSKVGIRLVFSFRQVSTTSRAIPTTRWRSCFKSSPPER